MSFNIEVTNPRLHPSIVPHRIVPVRFARAISGFADRDAPDLDDHGFIIPTANCNALGPVVGIIQNRTIRVKVIRDRVAPTTQLFPSIDDVSIAALSHPVAGSALDTNDASDKKGDCIYLDGVATGSTDKETKLKLHYGAADGPVVAEMAIRVYPQLVIPVQAHSVSINGVPSTTTLNFIQQIFEHVNRIYAQAGVRFSVESTLMNESVTGFTRNGTVTLTATTDARNRELQTVLRQHPVADTLNAYFFAHYFDTENTNGGPAGTFDQVLGIAFSRDTVARNPPDPARNFPGCQAGITMMDSTDLLQVAHTTAHEIGHSLRLTHYRNSVAGVRHDIWAHRCLMHDIVGLNTTPPSSAARTLVGYGNLSDGTVATGQLLMTKEITNISQSNQIFVLRDATNDTTFAPI